MSLAALLLRIVVLVSLTVAAVTVVWALVLREVPPFAVPAVAAVAVCAYDSLVIRRAWRSDD